MGLCFNVCFLFFLLFTLFLLLTIIYSLQPPNDPHGITKEELILALRAVLTGTPKFAEVGQHFYYLPPKGKKEIMLCICVCVHVCWQETFLMIRSTDYNETV